MVWNEPGKNNNKDPWESGGHSPDLERLVRNVQRKLNALFGGGKPGGGMHSITIVWVLPVLLALWLASGFFTVAAGNRSVIMTFGHAGETVRSGLHWHLPWPVGSQITVAGVDQGRDYTHVYNQLITRDGNVISVSAQVHYQIADLRDYLFKVSALTGDGNGSSVLFASLTDSAIRSAVARTPLEAMLGNDRVKTETAAHELLQAALKRNNVGLAATRLVFQRVDVPDSVAAAYAEVRKAKQDSQQLQDSASVYENRVIDEAKGQSDAEVTEANAYRIKQVSEARADVARFNEILDAYRADPSLTREQLYLQTMEDVLGSASKVVVDGHGNVTVQFSAPPAAPVKSPPASSANQADTNTNKEGKP